MLRYFQYFGTNSVASRVVAVEGVPFPARYRMYRIKTVGRG